MREIFEYPFICILPTEIRNIFILQLVTEHGFFIAHRVQQFLWSSNTSSLKILSTYNRALNYTILYNHRTEIHPQEFYYNITNSIITLQKEIPTAVPSTGVLLP